MENTSAEVTQVLEPRGLDRADEMHEMVSSFRPAPKRGRNCGFSSPDVKLHGLEPNPISRVLGFHENSPCRKPGKSIRGGADENEGVVRFEHLDARHQCVDL